MIEWTLMTVMILVTIALIGRDLVRRRPHAPSTYQKVIEEARDDGTRRVERQAVVDQAKDSVDVRAAEIEKIKHETEILNLVVLSPEANAAAPAALAAPAAAPAASKGDAPAGSSDTTMIRIVKIKLDEAQKLVDKRSSGRRLEGGLAR